MKKLSVLLVMLAFSIMPALSQTGKMNNFKIKRGTNVSHWLSQSEARGEMRRLHIQEEDFARLENLGFDFVRIPIDEVQFWDEQDNKLPEAWTLLTNALDWAGKHHLRAIVDLHIIRSHNFNAENEGRANTLFTSEKAQQDLLNLWYQLSDVLKGYSLDWVAYEFMNEPVAKEHEQWNQLVAKKYGLQLFCGEWGIYERTPREMGYEWVKDMPTLFDEFNIASTTWCYDADFGFWDQQHDCYKDKPLVDLLTGK